MTKNEDVVVMTSPIGSGVFLSGADSSDPLKGKTKDVGCVNSTTKGAAEGSLSGVVDAILEVGRERKSLLDQMRSALLSSNDAEALRFARQLCGLPG